MDVRPIDEGDLDKVAEAMPWRPRAKHAERAAAQATGDAVYLIAWRDGVPIGHAFVKWAPALLSRHAREQGCPELEDLYVGESDREGGAGTDLVAAAEDEARRRGATRLGLATGIDDGYAAARRIYERRGFRDAGYGHFLLRFTTVGDDGVERTGGGDVCTYLVKRL